MHKVCHNLLTNQGRTIMQNTRIIDPPGLILTSGAYMSRDGRSWVQLLSIFENQVITITKQLLCLFKNRACYFGGFWAKYYYLARYKKVEHFMLDFGIKQCLPGR